jgi:3-methyladenine DNA glycosylase/8-oxoguanine DNA glycosylase
MFRSVARATVAPRGGRYDLRFVLGRRRARVIETGPNAVVAEFRPEGSSVDIELFTIGEPDVDRAMETAIGVAGLRDDPTGFDDVAKRHPTIARLQRRFGGTRLARTATVFESFATAVVQQLVTYEEASASLRRLIYRYGQKIGDFTAFPTAAEVAAIPPHELRAIGIGIRRATTLRQGATRGAALERLRTFSPEEVIARAQSMRGVGVWTATKIAIEACGYADALLLGDAVLPFAVTMALTGTAGRDDAMTAALEPFRPHRARVVRLIGLAQLYDDEVPGVPRKPLPQIDPHRRYPWRS